MTTAVSVAVADKKMTTNEIVQSKISTSLELSRLFYVLHQRSNTITTPTHSPITVTDKDMDQTSEIKPSQINIIPSNTSSIAQVKKEPNSPKPTRSPRQTQHPPNERFVVDDNVVPSKSYHPILSNSVILANGIVGGGKSKRKIDDTSNRPVNFEKEKKPFMNTTVKCTDSKQQQQQLQEEKTIAKIKNLRSIVSSGIQTIDKMLLTSFMNKRIASFDISGEKCLWFNQLMEEFTFTFDDVENLHVNLIECSVLQLLFLALTKSNGLSNYKLIRLSDAYRILSYKNLILQSPQPQIKETVESSKDKFLIYHDVFGFKTIGVVSLNLYSSDNSPCIRCEKCLEYFAPPDFIIHSHQQDFTFICWGFHTKNWRRYIYLQNHNEAYNFFQMTLLKQRFDITSPLNSNISTDLSKSNVSNLNNILTNSVKRNVNLSNISEKEKKTKETKENKIEVNQSVLTEPTQTLSIPIITTQQIPSTTNETALTTENMMRNSDFPIENQMQYIDEYNKQMIKNKLKAILQVQYNLSQRRTAELSNQQNNIVIPIPVHPTYTSISMPMGNEMIPNTIQVTTNQPIMFEMAPAQTQMPNPDMNNLKNVNNVNEATDYPEVKRSRLSDQRYTTNNKISGMHYLTTEEFENTNDIYGIMLSAIENLVKDLPAKEYLANLFLRLSNVEQSKERESLRQQNKLLQTIKKLNEDYAELVEEVNRSKIK
ncbi:hypothetical protein SNEBB_009224 [Seison nebaliae]|nr:hypothetical protein SNEBB_009224 [Seison nebaliae]